MSHAPMSDRTEPAASDDASRVEWTFHLVRAVVLVTALVAAWWVSSEFSPAPVAEPPGRVQALR